MTALVKAVEERRFHQAKLLVKNGYNVNSREKQHGRTALIAACQLQQEKTYIVKWLLRQGASPRIADRHGLTPLMHACRTKSTRVVNLLLKERELDISAQDNNGDSVLIYAVRTGNMAILDAILKEFVKRRISCQDQANNIGETPLIVSAKLGYQDLMEKLLKKGKCSPQARDFELMLTAEEWSEKYFENPAKNCFNTSKSSPQTQPRLHRNSGLCRSAKYINNDINESKIASLKVNHVERMKSQKISKVNKASTLKECGSSSKKRPFYAVHNGNPNNKVYPSQERSKLLRRKSGKSVLSTAHVPSRHSANLTSNVIASSHHVVNNIQEKKFTSVKARLPELYTILQAQKTHSYRLKAIPPPTKSAQQLPSSPLRAGEALKRFAKAGFASIALNKLTFGRKSRGSAESVRFRPSTPSLVSDYY